MAQVEKQSYPAKKQTAIYMQATLRDINDLDGILNVILVSTKSSVDNIPQPRPDDASREDPYQRIPKGFAIFTSARDFTCGTVSSI